MEDKDKRENGGEKEKEKKKRKKTVESIKSGSREITPIMKVESAESLGIEKKKKKKTTRLQRSSTTGGNLTLPLRRSDDKKRKPSSFEFWQHIERVATQQESTAILTPPTAVRAKDDHDASPTRHRKAPKTLDAPISSSKSEVRRRVSIPADNGGKPKTSQTEIVKKPQPAPSSPIHEGVTRSNSVDGIAGSRPSPRIRVTTTEVASSESVVQAALLRQGLEAPGKRGSPRRDPFGHRKAIFNIEDTHTTHVTRKMRSMSTGSLPRVKADSPEIETREVSPSGAKDIVKEFFEKKLKAEMEARKQADLALAEEKRRAKKLEEEKSALEGELNEARKELEKMKEELEQAKLVAKDAANRIEEISRLSAAHSDLKSSGRKERKRTTSRSGEESKTPRTDDDKITPRSEESTPRSDDERPKTDDERPKSARALKTSKTKKHRKHDSKGRKEKKKIKKKKPPKKDDDNSGASSEHVPSDAEVSESESEFSDSGLDDTDSEFSMSDFSESENEETKEIKKLKRRRTSIFLTLRRNSSGKEASTKAESVDDLRSPKKAERTSSKERIDRRREKRMLWKMRKKAEEREKEKEKRDKKATHKKNDSGDKSQAEQKQADEEKDQKEKKENERKGSKDDGLKKGSLKGRSSGITKLEELPVDWDIESPKRPAEEPTNESDYISSPMIEEMSLHIEDGSKQALTTSTRGRSNSWSERSGGSRIQGPTHAPAAGLLMDDPPASPKSPTSPARDGSARLKLLAKFELKELRPYEDLHVDEAPIEKEDERDIPVRTRPVAASSVDLTSLAKEKLVIPPLKLKTEVSPRKKSTGKVHKTFGDRLGALLTARPTKEQLVQQHLLDGAVFGVPLESLLDASHSIPPFVENAMSYIEQSHASGKNLFTGEGIDKDKVKELKGLLNEGKGVDLGNYSADVVAEILRRFFDQLPEPLIPENTCNRFLDATEIEFFPSIRNNAFHSLLYSLPSHCRQLLQKLISLLALIWKSATDKKRVLNRMCDSLGPVLFRLQDTYPPQSALRLKQRAIAVQVMVIEAEHLFGEMDLVYQMKEGKQLVFGGSFEQLVEKLVDPYYLETEYVDIMFLTHTYFTTSVEFLRKLITIYEMNNHLPSVASKNWQHRIRLRILDLLKTWVTDYFNDLAQEENFIQVLLVFTEPKLELNGKASIIEEEEKVFSYLSGFISFMEEKRKQDRPVATRSLSFYRDPLHPDKRIQHRKQPSLKSSEESKDKDGKDEKEKNHDKDKEKEKNHDKDKDKESNTEKKERKKDKGKEDSSGGKEEKSAEQAENSNDNGSEEGVCPTIVVETHPALDLLEVDPEHIASQLTLIDHELYRAIKKKELIKKRFLTPSTSPAFNSMVERFNLTGQWVSAEILSRESVSARAQMIGVLIRVCEQCRKMHNFNSVFAILAGLNATPVSRLRQSWEKVPRKEMSEYKKLMKLVDIDGNYRYYRQTLQNAKPPLIPYLALFSKDLFNVEDANATILEDGNISVNKLRMVWRLVAQFTSYQIQYPITMDPNLRGYLKGIVPIPEIKAYEISYKLEPPKNASASYM